MVAKYLATSYVLQWDIGIHLIGLLNITKGDRERLTDYLTGVCNTVIKKDNTKKKKKEK